VRTVCLTSLWVVYRRHVLVNLPYLVTYGDVSVGADSAVGNRRAVPLQL
jgi:hypothetical protein